ncbi:MAG: hypothetical protein LAO22_06155 [Acidobacteriia bacterium]|nr:hypothetical protein [Terriglobia bacterium]
MHKTNKLFLNSATEGVWPNQASDKTPPEFQVRITDQRVAQLLIVLHEIDECVEGLEDLSEPQLSELVGQAILACGFDDPTEARIVIAEVLEAIHPECSPPQDYS